MSKTMKQRPGTMRLIDALQYRLPVAGLVSILHRVSGALMFVLLPFIIWMFDNSIASEASHARLTSVFADGAGALPGWFFKLVVLALVWAYLHHFIAGLRHLWMDVTHASTKSFGQQSAMVALVLSIALTFLLGYRVFF